jgi:type IV pilus assembly protein PilC
MKYNYQARTKEGKMETGSVEASSREAAAFLLQKYDIFVTSLVEDTPKLFLARKVTLSNKISKKDLAIFFRQLAVMLSSRVPVVQSLKGLAVQTSKENFKEKIMRVAQLVEEGRPLSEAFMEYPEIFTPFYVSLIKSGEASGKISDSLYYLSDHLEREDDITSQIKSAMIYPAFVLSVLFVVVLIVMFGVMPRISELLQETSSNPPFFTSLMLGLYDFLRNFGWVLLVAFLLLAGFIAYYFKTKEGKKRYDEIALKFPFFGELLKKTYLIRFAESVSTLISAGLSINDTLRITADTIENSVYKNIIYDAEKSVSRGEKISAVFIRYPKNVPPFVVQMIEVGEGTGKLDKTLMEIVNFYQKEVKRSIETFTALLEPVLIIFLGTFVALLAISVLSPLYGALGTI